MHSLTHSFIQQNTVSPLHRPCQGSFRPQGSPLLWIITTARALAYQAPTKSLHGRLCAQTSRLLPGSVLTTPRAKAAVTPRHGGITRTLREVSQCPQVHTAEPQITKDDNRALTRSLRSRLITNHWSPSRPRPPPVPCPRPGVELTHVGRAAGWSFWGLPGAVHIRSPPRVRPGGRRGTLRGSPPALSWLTRSRGPRRDSV